MDTKKEGETTIDNWRSYLLSSRSSFNERWSQIQKSSVGKSDFKFIHTLYDRESSKVELAEKNKTLYAVKIICKMRVKKESIHQVLNELRTLQAARFPFIIHMTFFFSDPQFYYFVMPYIPGGDLWFYLRRVGKFPERDSKFYASQILLALEYLHFMRVIYRDLKPENILVNADGYLKLADLGFCKRIVGRTYTMCGTAEYMPPEVLLNKGHGFAADWWSFGVFLYEMSAGYTPFLSESVLQMCNNISQGLYKIPDSFTNNLKNLVSNLLVLDPSKRFGCQKRGVDDIKYHSWFKEINWMDVLNRKVSSRIQPVLELNLISEAPPKEV